MSKKYLMSSPQKRLFSIDQMQDPNITYNIPIVLKIKGHLQVERLQTCIDQLIQRHEILRTWFSLINGKFIQHVEETVTCIVEYQDSMNQKIEQYVETFVRPFDLTRAPLMHICICQCEDNQEYLLIDFHHIVMDGGSMAIFLEELTKLYRSEELEPLKLQYKDYSAWLRKQDLSRQEEYWRKLFSDGIPETELPLDYSRSKNQTFSGRSIELLVKGEVKRQVKELGINYQATEYMVVLAAFMLFLNKYTRKQDIIVGTPISGRKHPETQMMLGMFVNTLVLKGKVETGQTFAELINHVRDVCLGAFDHQDYEFEALVNLLNIKRAENRNPVFNIMFALQNNDNVQVYFDDNEAEEYALNSKVAKFDLTFNFGENSEGYVIIWEYNTTLFRDETIKRMLHHFKVLFLQAVSHPDQIVSELSCLDEPERHCVTKGFNHTPKACPAESTITQLFENIVMKYPERAAVMYKEQVLTYQELNNIANGIATILIKEGIEKNEFIGIIAEKRVEVIAGIIGILKAGGAYLPLDPQNPINRTKYILADSRNRLILGFPKQGEMDFGTSKVLDLDELFQQEDIFNNVICSDHSSDLAYLMYTSGTTGEPKGTMIEHKSVIRLVKNTDYVNFENIRILQTGSLTFDASTFEIWGALLNGGFLLLADNEEITNCSAAKRNIERFKINTMWLTAALFNQMVTMDVTMFDRLQTLLIGGEKLSEKHVKMLLEYNEKIVLINGYGPTECTTFALTHKIERPVFDTIPIGTPIKNTTVYILNALEICGIGMPGELCIGGPGVSRGYLNREELTREKFIADPFHPGQRLYRTGDLARWRDNGEVDYLGRIDEQVKIRGFRIELPEIEKQIEKMKGVKAVTVVVKEKEGDKILCAYLVSEDEFEISTLKENLRESLPEYMIPQIIMQLDKLPVTVNGKLDIRQLPMPVATTKEEYVEPQNERQENMCKAFQEVLERERVGIHDSFFELGGDSIKAIRLVSKLRDYGYELSIKSIMQRKTVSALEADLKVVKFVHEEGAVTGECRISPVQSYFFKQKLHKPGHFNQSFIFETDKIIDQECMKKTLYLLFEHHDGLRTSFHEKENQWCPYINENIKLEIKYYDLTEVENTYNEMERIGNREQTLLSIEQDRLINVVIYKAKKKSYLLLIIHHLLVDGVSWRIIEEDLNAIYYSFINGLEPVMPSKTTSFKAWTESLFVAGHSKLEEEISYWKEIECGIKKNKIFYTALPGEFSREKLVTYKLTTDYARKLIYELNGITDINTILLLCLVRTVQRLCGVDDVSFCMEGHGRVTFDEKTVIDRTVGWFTNLYPICFHNINKDIMRSIEKVKQSLDSVPNYGVGYGILSTYRNELVGILPQITYNYLGEFTSSKESSNIFQISEAPSGREIAEQNTFGTPLSVNSVIVKKELHVNIGYNTKFVTEEFARMLGEEYLAQIKEVLKFISNNQTALEYRYDHLSGITKKIWDVYRKKVISKEVMVENERYCLLFVTEINETIRKEIRRFFADSCEEEIDYILGMEKLYEIESRMSKYDLQRLCNDDNIYGKKSKIERLNRYDQAPNLYEYIPSVMQDAFLQELEESWVELRIPVRSKQPETLINSIQRIRKEQSAFRTSALRNHENVAFCEHEFQEITTIPIFDKRYLSPEKREKIKAGIARYQESVLATKEGYIPLYSLHIEWESEMKYQVCLKISHCIWDKQSEAIFVRLLQKNMDGLDVLSAIPRAPEENSNYAACKLMKHSVQKARNRAIHDRLQVGPLKKAYQSYRKATEGIEILRYEMVIVDLNDKMKALYQSHQWDFIVHLAKLIISANTGIINGDIPIYIVQEDRRYLGDVFTDRIGAYIDLLPMCINIKEALKTCGIEGKIASLQQIKMENQLNIREFLNDSEKELHFEYLYAINIQKIFELNTEQLKEMRQTLKDKKAGSGYEIFVNENKESLIFAYPITNLCKCDIKNILDEECRNLVKKEESGLQ